MALASMTIVSDLPLPCVCQTTPPLRRAVRVPLAGSARWRSWTREVLLIAGDLLLACVEQREVERQFQQPLRPAEAVERPVLVGDSRGLLLQVSK